MVDFTRGSKDACRAVCICTAWYEQVWLVAALAEWACKVQESKRGVPKISVMIERLPKWFELRLLGGKRSRVRQRTLEM